MYNRYVAWSAGFGAFAGFNAVFDARAYCKAAVHKVGFGNDVEQLPGSGG